VPPEAEAEEAIGAELRSQVGDGKGIGIACLEGSGEPH
jgi:hypothetical protein